MATQTIYSGTANTTRQSGIRLGFWTSLLTAGAAGAALGIAITTAPARSGPNCMVRPCVTYPYTDVAAFVPIEYIWMVPALLLAMLFVVLTVCIHQRAPVEKKVFSQTALSFAVISATAHVINYFIQLAVVQPSLIRGELESLILYSQYNPHGIFIALEDVGYLIMGVAFLFIAFVFEWRSRLGRSIQLIFFSSAVLNIGSLIFLTLLLGSDLEYMYEVASILIVWITLMVAGVLLSLFFWRAGQPEIPRLSGASIS